MEDAKRVLLLQVDPKRKRAVNAGKEWVAVTPHWGELGNLHPGALSWSEQVEHAKIIEKRSNSL